jgi:lipopolysaccharide transport system permease protein
MLRDLIAARELAWRLFVRDISAMYRQSMLGYIWAFLPPLATALSFTILNANGIIRVGETPVPYSAFVAIGTLLWQTFTDAVNSPMRAVNSNRSLLAKINFPREALLLSGAADVLFNFVVRSTLLIPLFAYYHIPLSPLLLLAPLALFGLLALGFSIGLLITPVAMLYNDVGRGLGILTGFWMLLTPVVYPAPRSGLGAWLAHWNPVSPLLLTARDWLTGQPASHLPESAIVTLIALAALISAWVLYRLAMPFIIERIGV